MLLPFVVYRQLLEPGHAPADFDAVSYLYPYRHYLAEAWSSGRWVPLWNPSIYLGTPFLANIQAAALYPLSLVFLVVAGPSAMGWSMVIQLLIAGLGMFTFGLRAARLRVAGALVAALAYVLSSHLTVHLAQINQISTLAWTPWLMLAFDRGATRPGRIGAVFIGVVTALTLLAGHTQQAYLTFLTAGLAGLLALGTELRHRRLRAVGLAAATWAGGVALGAGIAAAQLVPTAELESLSYRQGGLDVAAANVEPLPLKGILGSLLPHYSGPLPPEFAGVSMGAAVLFLAAVAVLARWRRPPVAFWTIVSLLALWSATGTSGRLYTVIFHVVPGMDLFRAPGRLLLLSTVGIALLAGYGVKTAQQLAVAGRRARWAWRGLGIPVAVAVMGAAMAAAVLLGRSPVAAGHRLFEFLPLGVDDHDLALMSGFAAAAVAICAVSIRLGGRQSAAVAGILLPALVLSDSWLATQNYHTRRSVDASVYADSGPATRLVPATPNQRFLSLVSVTDFGNFQRLDDARRPNLGMGDGRLSADGYDGGLLPTGAYVQFRRPVLGPDSTNPPDLTILGQTTRVWDPSWLYDTGLSLVLTDPGVDPNPPGCECLKPVAVDEGIQLWRATGTPSTRAWVDGSSGRLPAHVTEDTGERVVVELPDGPGGNLILADAAYPGWSAAVDGRPANIRTVRGLLRSVDVSARAHRVVFTYQPASFRVGVGVTVLAFVTMLLLLALPTRFRFRTRWNPRFRRSSRAGRAQFSP